MPEIIIGGNKTGSTYNQQFIVVHKVCAKIYFLKQLNTTAQHTCVTCITTASHHEHRHTHAYMQTHAILMAMKRWLENDHRPYHCCYCTTYLLYFHLSVCLTFPCSLHVSCVISVCVFFNFSVFCFVSLWCIFFFFIHFVCVHFSIIIIFQVNPG